MISDVGTYKDLLAKEGSFAEFINTHANKDNPADEDLEEGEEEDAEEEGNDPNSGSASPIPSISRRKSSVRSGLSPSRKNSQKPAPAADPPAPTTNQKSKLTTEEGIEKGRVKSDVLATYLRSVGWFFTALTLFMFLAQNGFMFYSSVWLKDWADGALPKGGRNASSSNETVATAAFSSEVYLGVYAVLGVAQGFTILLCKSESYPMAGILHALWFESDFRSICCFFPRIHSVHRHCHRLRKSMHIFTFIDVAQHHGLSDVFLRHRSPRQDPQSVKSRVFHVSASSRRLYARF